MKRKLQVLLMAMLLPLFNIKGQDSVSCVHDQFLQEYQDSNLRKGDISKIISYGTKRFREKNPDLQLYPKPMPAPAPPCEICMTIDPSCFKSKYALPVIVHIVAQTGHTTIGENSNIPDDQVYNALAAINKQFAGYGQPNPAVNTGIQFYLAPVGPDNNGIIRYNDALSSVAPLVFAPLRNLVDSPLNTNQFIHIFVVDTITQEGIMGYASYPETGFNHAVVVTRKRFGDASKSCTDCQLHSQSRNKTLAHELGHFLGLRHTFKDGCGPEGADCEIQGDGCCDTEPVAAPNFHCPVGRNTCLNSPADQIENFMDYTSESCAKWFTRNQTERMYFSLETFKQELIDLEHLFTYLPDICMFSARFKAYNNVVCDTGGVVTLKGIPYTTEGVKYIWTVYDSTQTVVFDTLANDHAEWSIYLQNPGRYDVRLQVIFGTDTATEMVRKLLWVVDCDGAMAHEGGNWFFGRFAGLVFGESGVRASIDAFDPPPGTVNTIEGGISISDPEGNLMFYGGGTGTSQNRGRVYNSNHARIRVSDNDFSGFNIANNCAQAAIVFPYPADTTVSMMLHSTTTYYGNLYYSLLYKKSTGFYDTVHNQVNLPVTLPDVMKNGDDAIDVKENLTVMRKCYGTGYWIATSIRFGSNFDYYYIAIISLEDTGFQLIDTFYIEEYNYGIFGQGRFSPDGTKYATFNHVFDFDRATGKLSFKYKLPFPDMAAYSIYGLTFSPNSRYLYWLGEDENTNNTYTYRIDLSFNNPISAIQQIGEAPNNDFYHGMQIGPDGRIYIANEGHDEIYVINSPDADWDGSHNPTGYAPFGVSLKIGEGAGAVGGTSTKGLPNHIDAKKADLVHDTIYYTIKNCRTVVFSTSACCRNSYLWLLGDNDTSHQKGVEKTFDNAGVYEVFLVLEGNDTIKVKVPLFNPKVRLVGDTLLCNQNQYVTYTALELDSFTKNYQLEWEIKDGTYSKHHSMGNTIVPNFDALPAQVIVHVVDPGSECTASDTITVSQISELQVNQINNGINEVIYCNEVDSFSLTGLEPDGSGFNYSWFYSLNNEDWHDMEIYTQNLPNQLLKKTMYLKRLVYPDACENWSNVVKIMPRILNNWIYPDFPVCSQEYNYSKLRSDTVFVNNSYQSDSYYYKWQTSSNGHTWSDVEAYKHNIGYGNWDWWYNALAYDHYMTEDSVVFIRKAIFSVNCEDYSNVVKVNNYNLEDVTGIEINPTDSSLVTGLMLMGNDTLISTLWQHSCDGSAWDDITSGFNHDTLFELENYFPDFIRRKIYKYNKYGHLITGCENISYLNYEVITGHPISQAINVGDSTILNIAFLSAIPFNIQWQKYNETSFLWEDLESKNQLELIVVADRCNDQSQYRAVLSNDCQELISNIATLTVNNQNSDFFLWLKDVPADTAAEPNTEMYSYEESFLSPDIIPNYVNTPHPVSWNDHWGVSYLQYDGVFIHTRIRNKGADTSRGGKLYLYASISAFNDEWDIAFSGVPQMVFDNGYFYMNHYYDTLGNIFTTGTKINEIGLDIPRIPPGGDTIISYLWNDAEVQFYKSTFKHPVWGWTNQYNRNAITYYARIEECQDFPHNMTHEEVFFPNAVNTAWINVQNNARIARLKSHYLPTKPPLVVSTSDEPDLWDIINNNHDIPLRIEFNSDSAQVFYATGEVYVYFDQNLWNAFVSGGSVGDGFAIEGDGIFIISDPDLAYWENIILEPDSTGYVGYSLHYKDDTDTSGLQYKNKFMVKMLTDSNRICGITHLHTDSRLPGITAMSTIPNHDKELLKDNLAAQEPPQTQSIKNTQPKPSPSLVLSAQPNPFDQKLHVLVANYEPGAYIHIRDMKGTLVEQRVLPPYTDKKPAVTIEFNTTQWSSGVYFVQYESASKMVNKKVVLVR